MRPRLLRATLTVLSVLVGAAQPIDISTGAPANAGPATLPSANASVSTSFSAQQDGYVNANSPDRTYATSDLLAVAASPTRLSYLQFEVSDLASPVARAVLRIHTRDEQNAASPTGGTVWQAGTGWSEATLTYSNRPPLFGTSLATLPRVASNTWYQLDVTAAVTDNGLVAFAISSTNADGAYYDSRETGTGPQLVVDTGTSTGIGRLLAAGDISSCANNHDEETAAILDQQPGTLLPLGDLAYDSGTSAEFANCYDPTWGRHRARSRPVPGNHDYLTAGAAPYYAYFGPAAGDPAKGYYSYDLAGWHIVALNSNCSQAGGCQSGSPQEQWLRTDLAANPASCTLAYWHHPAFSSGGRESTSVLPLFRALYQAGVEIVLNGHAHQYERFAPQDPDRNADPLRGIREFVVGTGGKSLQNSFPTIVPNSEVRNGTAYGVLQLTLRDGGYDWRFLPAAGASYTDTGSGTCH